MSLIEREKLLDHLDACLAESDGKTPSTDEVPVAIRCAVEQMPEVDAVPVVRCGECKYHSTYVCRNDFTGISHHCECGVPTYDDDFYCFFGERR